MIIRYYYYHLVVFVRKGYHLNPRLRAYRHEGTDAGTGFLLVLLVIYLLLIPEFFAMGGLVSSTVKNRMPSFIGAVPIALIFTILFFTIRPTEKRKKVEFLRKALKKQALIKPYVYHIVWHAGLISILLLGALLAFKLSKAGFTLK
jgi:hypothetical protein